MGAVGASKSSSNQDVYKVGKSTFYITSEDGKTYYLHQDHEGNANIKMKWKIAYANNDEKARVYIPELKQYIEFKNEPQILKLLQNKREGSLSGQAKNVSFADMMKQATDAGNQITFGKIVTISPKGYIPETGKKGDLGKLVDKYNVNSVVVNMYRDKSGANDMKRLKELGFEIKSQTLGTQQEGSKIPPKDYYYMVRKKK